MMGKSLFPIGKPLFKSQTKPNNKSKMRIALLAGTSILALFITLQPLDARYPLEGENNVKIARVAWFGQYGWGKFDDDKANYTWRDWNSGYRSALREAKFTEPGIALPTRKTLGHWFDVEIKGKVFRVRQTDVGPSRWSRRQMMINAALADLAGYSPRNFPTNKEFRYRYFGKEYQLASLTTPKTEESDEPKLIHPPKEVTRPPKKRESIEIEPNIKALVEHLLNIHPQIVGKYPSGLHPVIKTSMIEASKYLPKGYKIRFISAARGGSRVGRRSYHVMRERYQGRTYALAADISIVDSRGKSLKNLRAPNNFKIYREFMQTVKKIQYDKFPAYRGRGRWGGYFVFGVSQDLMHYDLGPEKGTMAGNWHNGLKPRFAHFGKRHDIGKGMGRINAFKLPNLFPKKDQSFGIIQAANPNEAFED